MVVIVVVIEEIEKKNTEMHLMQLVSLKNQLNTKHKQKLKKKIRARAQRATMKISDDISVMEGFTDEPFTLKGVEGTRGKILGTIGSAVGGYWWTSRW